jgi:hypothetical protein
MLWPLIFKRGNEIAFAHRSFLWKNLASNNAGVTCIVVGLSIENKNPRRIFDEESERIVDSISPYLTANSSTVVLKNTKPMNGLTPMVKGNQPSDQGALIFSPDEASKVSQTYPNSTRLFRNFVGSRDFINGGRRLCAWIRDEDLTLARSIPPLLERIQKVEKFRTDSSGTQSRQNAHIPHRFVYAPHEDVLSIIIPRHFSERREYLTVGVLDGKTSVIADSASAIYHASLVDFAILSSALHISWVAVVGGRIKTDYRYSNTLVWNTFPLPKLTEKNKEDLIRCAEDILLARESHWPATIADLYAPDRMPDDLRAAHERNDEVLERIYIGRRFKNDTERLEKLFELYTKMTTKQGAPDTRKAGSR